MNELVSTLIAQSTTSDTVSRTAVGSQSLVWTWANDLELVFVAAYQRILELSYVDALVQLVKQAFVAKYSQSVALLRRAITSGTVLGRRGFDALFDGWGQHFLGILRDLESRGSSHKVLLSCLITTTTTGALLSCQP